VTVYNPPVKDILFAINELASLDAISSLPAFESASAEMVSTLIAEAAKFFAEVLAPLNGQGDQQGASLDNGDVSVPEAFVHAYQQLQAGGWPALSFPESEGGFGFPGLVELAIVEMMQSANLSFSMCPLLAPGVARVLRLQADESIKSQYLSKIASGEWATAMSLTEPQSGSDLSGLKTSAQPDGEFYRIKGQKIFISWADHNMTANILHLVLARLPDAPVGARGLSLFLVPKFISDDNGGLGQRNDFSVLSLEHKLGLKACPTCTVNYGDNEGAIGYLVGQSNNGLSAMFILMNHARIQVGMQGAALVERAYQMSVDFAGQRIQGTIKSQGNNQVAIIQHPDVRRMLGLMKAGKDAIKALAYTAAAELDLSEHSSGEKQRALHASRVALLTPIMKGWGSEFSQELVQLAVQIHGGMGYIEETGVTQFMRDARVTTIFEGTSAIQAKDLLRRKLLADGGEAYRVLLAEMRSLITELNTAGTALASLAANLSPALDLLDQLISWVLDHRAEKGVSLDTIAFDFMMLSGYVMGGWLLSRSALLAQRKLAKGEQDIEFLNGKISAANFYMKFILPRSQSHAQIVLGGGQGLEGLVL